MFAVATRSAILSAALALVFAAAVTGAASVTMTVKDITSSPWGLTQLSHNPAKAIRPLGWEI